MDVARSSVRLGADKVAVAYRRRKADMTALPEEVESAMAEGVEIMELTHRSGLKQTRTAR